jgi:hypothetical protein
MDASAPLLTRTRRRSGAFTTAQKCIAAMCALSCLIAILASSGALAPLADIRLGSAGAIFSKSNVYDNSPATLGSAAPEYRLGYAAGRKHHKLGKAHGDVVARSLLGEDATSVSKAMFLEGFEKGLDEVVDQLVEHTGTSPEQLKAEATKKAEEIAASNKELLAAEERQRANEAAIQKEREEAAAAAKAAEEARLQAEADAKAAADAKAKAELEHK